MKVNCPICNKEIKIYPYEKGKVKCCSYSCASIYRYQKYDNIGFQKNNKLRKGIKDKLESKIKKSQSKIGKNNPMWEGGISQDYYRKFLKFTCEMCNKKANIVHHRDRDRKNNNLNNLQSLCNSCHISIHKSNQTKKIIVSLSGGQDSVTTLQWALHNFKEVEAITVDYGQRHKIEIEQAKKIAKKCNIKHTIISLKELFSLTKSALINTTEEIIEEKGKLPTSFVPGRNIIFILALGIYAYKHDIHHIALGVCETDFSGYPDCRNDVIKQTEELIRSGFEYDFSIHTPLMWLSKKEELILMKKLNGLDLLKYTQTCYEGKRPACGKCPACKLRLKGFKEANLTDPLEYEKEVKKNGCKF